MKVFLGESHKRSDSLSESGFRRYAATWRRELDAMAEHGVLPQLVVAFGRQFWHLVCEALRPGLTAYEHIAITEFETCGSASDASFNHANRVGIVVRGKPTNLLLVRLSHPSARDQRRAKWLLERDAFRRLARLAE